MTTENIALFKALGAKMDFLNQRQRIIAQNVSNADTPGYLPHDLRDADFGRVLKKVIDQDKLSVSMETTQARHLPTPGTVVDPKNREQKQVYEVAPEGNAVIMEEQLIKAGRNTMDYNLMTNLYQKNVGMIQTALGIGA